MPGHGASPAQTGISIEQAAAAVAEPFPLPVHLVGWSLGGLLAQYWAAQWPDTVRSLTLISTTPRFVIDAGWPHGMGRDRLAATAYRLDVDFDQTLRQFLALQTLGAPDARQTLQALSAMLFAHGRPKGLHDGLNWLLDARGNRAFNLGGKTVRRESAHRQIRSFGTTTERSDPPQWSNAGIAAARKVAASSHGP